MPDFMDAVQERVQQETEDAIASVTRRRDGAAECDECGDAVSDLRRSMGARLCLAHQAEAEQRARARR